MFRLFYAHKHYKMTHTHICIFSLYSDNCFALKLLLMAPPVPLSPWGGGICTPESQLTQVRQGKRGYKIKKASQNSTHRVCHPPPAADKHREKMEQAESPVQLWAACSCCAGGWSSRLGIREHRQGDTRAPGLVWELNQPPNKLPPSPWGEWCCARGSAALAVGQR